MTVVRRLLDAESNMSNGVDHSKDLAFAAVTFGVLFLILLWKCRTMLFQECFTTLSAGTGLAASSPLPTPPPGLKNAALKLLPTVSYTAEATRDTKDCAICLTEFADGDLTRVLPQCGHLFHVICVDQWLRAHSSCPSCRQLVIVISKPSAATLIPIQMV